MLHSGSQPAKPCAFLPCSPCSDLPCSFFIVGAVVPAAIRGPCLLKCPPLPTKPVNVPDSSLQTAFSWRPVSLLAGVMALRMLGLFMVLPVLALYAEQLPGATPLLVGLAVGVYGVTQALLQIPLGAASDTLGRKPVIIVGLLIFAAGSGLAALGGSIWTVVAGRALQGAGAISAAVIALVADLSPAHCRTRAMAVLGISIGTAFALAMVAGPLLAGWLSVPGVFWLTAGLALAAATGVAWLIPAGQAIRATAVRRPRLALLRLPALRSVALGVFLLHGTLTALFTVLPGVLRDLAGLAADRHWELYLPALGASLLLTLPLIKLSERGERQAGVVIQVAIGLLTAGLLGLALAGGRLPWLGLALAVFFGGFNFLEASLPARVSLAVAEQERGAALGLYATCQFLGAFAGGLAGGVLGGWLAAQTVFFLSAGLVLGWLLFVWGYRTAA